MLREQDRFRPNAPHVTSERFDDEVVIVNFESGKYHSLQGTAASLWRFVEQGATVGEIVRETLVRYDGERPAIEEAVFAFLADLRNEDLAVPADGPAAAAGEPRGPEGPRTTFVPPVLATFSDMQELLWLDPIHEVDDAGWPVARGRDEA